MERSEATAVVNHLFDSLGPFLMRYTLRKTRSVELAEDIVQEAFLSLYRDLRTGKQIRDPRGWMVGAVRNQVRKHTRDSARHREELVSGESLDLVAGIPFEPEASCPVAESAPIELALLTPREEEVVLLRLQSLKYREIADQLGIGAKSVCTLLARALRKLQAVNGGTAVVARPAKASAKLRREVPGALH